MLTHSIWVTGSDDLKVARMKITAKRPKGLTHQYQEFTAEEIDRVADEIEEVTFELLLHVLS